MSFLQQAAKFAVHLVAQLMRWQGEKIEVIFNFLAEAEPVLAVLSITFLLK